MSTTTTPDTADLVARVQAHVESSGLSVGKVAKAAGVGDQTLRDLLSGKSQGTSVTRAKVNSYLLTVEQPAEAHENRAERVRAAIKERKALKAWQKDGEQGPRPATPNLDAIEAEHENGGALKAARKRSGKAPRAEQTVRLFHDGKPMPDSQNKLSSVAYYYTKGIGGDDVERIGVGELRDLLAKAGVSEPTTTAWEVTLPNGVTLAAKVEK